MVIAKAYLTVAVLTALFIFITLRFRAGGDREDVQYGVLLLDTIIALTFAVAWPIYWTWWVVNLVRGMFRG